MPEITITPATIFLGLSTIFTLFATIGSYIVFGNNEGNIIIVISFLFAALASYAEATDMELPTTRRRNSMSRARLSDTAAALTFGLFTFFMALLYGIIMIVAADSTSMILLGSVALLASALSLIGAILAQREYDG